MTKTASVLNIFKIYIMYHISCFNNVNMKKTFSRSETMILRNLIWVFEKIKKQTSNVSQEHI